MTCRSVFDRKRWRGLPARSGLRWALFALASFLPLSAALPADCNSNGVEDELDVASGFSEDCNGNGRPDACDGLPVALSLRDEVIEVASTARALEAADLDGDSRLDFVVGSRSGDTSTLSILLRRNDREFAVAEHPAEGLIYSTACGDLDGDGDLDIATANVDFLLVYANAGDGTLAEPVRIDQEFPTRVVVAADVTDDGFPDLIAAHHRGMSVSFRPNQGDGTFLEAHRLEVGDDPRAVAALDFDGDGDLDIASANRGSQSLSILLNQGAGDFAPAVEYPLAERFLLAVHASDLNDDGVADLVATTSLVVVVLFGQGDGSFVTRQTYPAPGARDVTVADVDGDVDMDLVLLLAGSDVLVRQNDGQGGFHVAVEERGFATVPAAVTLSQDGSEGDIELAIASTSPNALQFLVNGDGRALQTRNDTYKSLPGCIGTDPSCKPHSGNVADLDGDGDIDVIGASTEPGAFSLLINDGTGRMETPPAYTFGGVDPLYTAVGDMDNDGDIDAVTVDTDGRSLSVHLNQGDATFLRPKTVGVGSRPIHVLVEDLDGDGHLDAITANEAEATITLLFGNGTGDFDEPATFRVGRRPRAVAAGDLDGDGDLDLSVANSDENHLSVLLNQGERIFIEGSDLPLLGQPHFVVSGDIDRDGDDDLVTANSDIAAVSVLTHRGDGTFELAVDYATGPAPFSVFLVDYNVDGIEDLATASQAGSSISILLGRGDGEFDRPRVLPAGGEPWFAFPADFDQDGDPDLVSIDRGGLSLTIIHNEIRHDPDTVAFLDALCTAGDFHRLSARSAQADGADRFLHYTMPVESGRSPLPEVVFHNTERFGLAEDFLRAVFPESFADLTPETYRDLVEIRATREYYAGTILRARRDGSLLYGFTVDARWSDPVESLGADEVLRIYEHLRRAFLLEPLVYVPQSEAALEAAAGWGEDVGFPIYRRPVDTQPPTEAPTFELVIPGDRVVCGAFDVGREPLEELELKSTIELTGGSIALPTQAETFPASIVEELTFGPGREVVSPEGSGLFRVTPIPAGGESVVYRFTYEQEFVLPGGGRLVVELSPLDFRVDGGEPVVPSIVLDEERLNKFVFLRTGLERDEERADIFYASCHNESLPLWEIEAKLDDGMVIRLEERFRPDLVRDFGPASLAAADFRIGDERRVVRDYFHLVYSARRHNRRVVYWTLFEAPLEISGVNAPVHGVELRAPVERTGDPASVSYLGAALEVLVSPTVLSYQKIEVGAEARFRRGDLDGDGGRNITDVLELLTYLFRGGDAPACRKAADANDDGRINVVDAVAILASFLGRSMALAEPASECGVDPTPDLLPCRSECE